MTEAFWRGFVKAASHAGLTDVQICNCMKYAAAMPGLQQSSQIPPLGSPAMPQVGQQAAMNIPQSPANQGQIQMPLPFQFDQQKAMMPVPQSVGPVLR